MSQIICTDGQTLIKLIEQSNLPVILATKPTVIELLPALRGQPGHPGPPGKDGGLSPEAARSISAEQDTIKVFDFDAIVSASLGV